MTQRGFTVAGVFGDRMVLQRDKPVRIWGTCDRPQMLTAAIHGHQVASVRAEEGTWTMTLPPMGARRSLTLEIAGDTPTESIAFQDVAVGEVWIAGGQSNMEFPLAYDAEAQAVTAGASNPDIRFYDCAKVKFEGQEAEDDMSRYGFWRPCDPENAAFFSAVGYYFATRVYERFGVPVGVVGCNWSGTSAATWLDERFLAADEALSVYLVAYEASLASLDLRRYTAAEKRSRESMQNPGAQGFMRYIMKHTPGPLLYPVCAAITRSATRNPLPMGPRSENRPGGLYHTMLEKIAPYGARGVIWYQGESDDPRASLYARLFSAVIRCWREAWGDDLPFLFVQLAPYERWLNFRAESFALLREQQALVARTVPGTAMTSIMDAGARLDIHPKHKRPVGERLALLALGKVYGDDILCEGPEATGARLGGERLTITFANAGGGLSVRGRRLKNLVLMADGKPVGARSVSVGRDSVTVIADGLRAAREVEIRYAYENYAEVNLYNSADLPARPFRLTVNRSE